VEHVIKERIKEHMKWAEPHERIIVALDMSDPDEASAVVTQLEGKIGYVKIGLEAITNMDASVAIEIARGRNANWIHCTGGPKAIKQAVEARNDFVAHHPQHTFPFILGVTILTSLDYDDFAEMGIAPYHNETHYDVHHMNKPNKLKWIEFKKEWIEEVVVSLAKMAQRCGADGVVASPKEAKLIREACGDDFLIVTPGIRPYTAVEPDDQKRKATPYEAIRDGADFLVIGRPITNPPNGVTSLEVIESVSIDIKQALVDRNNQE